MTHITLYMAPTSSMNSKGFLLKRIFGSLDYLIVLVDNMKDKRDKIEIVLEIWEICEVQFVN